MKIKEKIQNFVEDHAIEIGIAGAVVGGIIMMTSAFRIGAFYGVGTVCTDMIESCEKNPDLSVKDYLCENGLQTK